MEVNGATQIVFRRSLVTNDTTNDVAISDRTLYLSWGYHSTSDDPNIKHDNRGIVGVNFVTGQTFLLNTFNAGQILLAVIIISLLVYSLIRWVYLLAGYLLKRYRKESTAYSMSDIMIEMSSDEVGDSNKPIQSPTSGSVYFKGSEIFVDETIEPDPEIEKTLPPPKQAVFAVSSDLQEKEVRSSWVSWILSHSRARLPFSQINIFDAIAFFFYVALHFVIIYGYPSAVEPWDEADNWGYIAAANLFLLMLPATR